MSSTAVGYVYRSTSRIMRLFGLGYYNVSHLLFNSHRSGFLGPFRGGGGVSQSVSQSVVKNAARRARRAGGRSIDDVSI
jgi:hypothetical protein